MATAVAVLGCGSGRHAETGSKTTTSQAIYVNPLTGKPAKATSNTKTGPAIYLIPSTGKPKCGYLNVGIEGE